MLESTEDLKVLDDLTSVSRKDELINWLKEQSVILAKKSMSQSGETLFRTQGAVLLIDSFIEMVEISREVLEKVKIREEEKHKRLNDKQEGSP